MQARDLERFLEVLNEITVSSVEAHIPVEDRNDAFRHSAIRYCALPARVVAYASSSGAVGWEYEPADEFSIEVVETDQAPAEAILESTFPALKQFRTTAVRVKGQGSAELQDARFSVDHSHLSRGASGDSGAGLVVTGTNLRISVPFVGFYPFRVAEGGFLRVVDSVIQFGTKQHTIRLAEIFGPEHGLQGGRASDADAVSAAQRDVMLAMRDVADAKRQSVDVSTFLKNARGTVLILGSFNDGLGRLHDIKIALRERGYRPYTLLDVPDHEGHDIRQKFQLLALTSDFVVFEDSVPSGHLVELVLANQAGIIVVVIREEGRQSTFMTAGGALVSKVMREWDYTASTLGQVISEASDWAESQAAFLRDSRKHVYPWRLAASETVTQRPPGQPLERGGS